MHPRNAGLAGDPELLTQRSADQIVGTLGCWDRVIITGTLTEACHAGAVETWLRRDDIRCFDLKVFAEPLRDQVRDHAIRTTRAAGLAIEHLVRRNFRKEDHVAEILRQRGPAPTKGVEFVQLRVVTAAELGRRTTTEFAYFGTR